jgi:hypothetical protein
MKNHLLIILLLAFSYLVFSSSSGGRAQLGENHTGAVGSDSSCSGSGCHSANNSDLNISITLVDLNNDTVKNGRYFPGAFYFVRLFAHTNIGSYSTFGFQWTATRSGNIMAGNYVATGSPDTKATVVAPVEIVEQDHPPYGPIPVTGFNNAFIGFLWQAPPAGAGTITMWTTMLLANNDVTPLGDKANNYITFFSQNPLGVDEISPLTNITVFPNPVRDNMHIRMQAAEKGNYSLIVHNMAGQIIVRKTLDISQTDQSFDIDLGSAFPGNYQLEIIKDGRKRILPFIKI